MQCPSCDSKKIMKSEVVIHKFKESGLDNIVLHGVKQYRCHFCGEVIFDFGDVNQLNRLISNTLIRKKDLLTGQEIRFLRTHIGYSSEMFARILGLDKTSLSRIENNRAKVSTQVNMAVRFAVAGKMADRDYDLHDLLSDIEAEHLLNFKQAEFKSSAKGIWQLQAG
jgi:putative zinc finger/helix-turn-helix YgiT family protein